MRIKHGTALAFFILCLSAILVHHADGQNPVKYSVIAIEYTGESDKPFAPIVISDSQAGADWYKNTVLKPVRFRLVNLHTVDGAFLLKLVASSDSFESALHRGTETGRTTMTLISITIVTPDRQTKSFYDKNSALSLIGKLKDFSDGYDSISSDLSKLSDLVTRR
jgi:hypothetical protein